MTLREKNHEPTTSLQRKYSVSQSGKFKSRPKIRPSLGDLFRPEASGATGSENQLGAITTADDGKRSTGSGGRGQLDMTTTSSSGTSGTTTITQQSSRGVYETAL